MVAFVGNGKRAAFFTRIFEYSRKEEELLVQTYINGLLQEHQQTMQQAINNQQDQKDYIDSWVHEIKSPLAAITLLVQSVEDDIPEKNIIYWKMS